MDTGLGKRGFGLILPHRIHQIILTSRERPARALHASAQPFDTCLSMQTRVVAEFAAFGEVFLQPFDRAIIRDVERLEQGGIGLIAQLQRVAPV